MRFALGLWIVSLLPVPVSGQILGAWSPESYVLKDGSEYKVSGLIVFTESDWTVLFFVEDEQGKVRRGSAEGGTYTLEGDRLTFTHAYHLSAGDEVGSLAESPLRMSVREAGEAATEPCEVDVGESSMTIRFPSGNRMMFDRSSGF